MATKPRGRGAKGLSGWATIRKELFFYCGFHNPTPANPIKKKTIIT